MANLVRAAESANITPIARLPRIAPDIILSYLDLGMQGIVAPEVETAEQAKNVVSWCKFYPEGVRGAGYGHFAEYYTLSGAAKVRAEANRETSVIIQIESKTGVDNLGEIVRIPGVDIIMMGPMDLSQSLGIPGQFDNPIHKAAMEKARETVLAAGKVYGDVCWNGTDARKKMAEGVRFVNYGLHDLLIAGAKQYLKEAEWSR
jgi:4-hydroxy-2-oxoheptanedioate aldolase